MWAVFGNSTLARLPSRGNVTTGYAGGGPTGIVYAEGAVWVTNGGDGTLDSTRRRSGAGPVETPTTVGSPERDRVRGGGALGDKRR